MNKKTCIMSSFIVFFVFCKISIANHNVNDDYEITIVSAQIASHKADGRGWDIRPKSPDPFVKVFIGGELVLQTGVKEDTYTPEWNESVNFTYKKGTSFRIEVWDRDAMSDDLIGKWEGDKLPGEKLSFGQVTKLSLAVNRQ